MNIQEDYVSFEITKLLKEKGFNSKCIAYYLVFNENIKFYECNNLEQSLPYVSNDNWGIILRNPLESGYAAPTLQMAMKWLRKVHKLHIEPHIQSYKNYNGNIYNLDGELLLGFTGESPEQACETAIKYCLEYLI